MSDVNDPESAELKGGHAPAVKVGGGVRITQHRQRSDSDREREKAEKAAQKEEEEKPNPNDEKKLWVSGVAVKGDKDFTADAVKSFHEKPLPTNQQAHFNPKHHIQQPSKRT